MEPLKQAYTITRQKIPKHPMMSITETERESLFEEIKCLLKQKHAIIVAHYYTDSNLQILAEETGGCVSDSLDMARFGHESDADTLIVCGVRFMGETAKILNPEKCILMPDINATCSLDIGCPANEFNRFCDAHADHTVVVYANTSAAVKARADWMVTSGSAVDVVSYLSRQGKKIIWAPDKYLGDYVQKQAKSEMLLWQATCVVHEEFKAQELHALRQKYPDAYVVVHPESPATVIEQADFVGSTSEMIKTVCDVNADLFIVATDEGIFHKMRQLAPDKNVMIAPTAGHGATCVSCAHCPWMGMNDLRKLANTLRFGKNEVSVDEEIAGRARIPIERLLNFTNKDPIKLSNDS